MASLRHEQQCDWTVGAFMIARREALLSAGIMDERFFLQCEEPDLCLRMKRAGWTVRHLPMMTIIHHAGKAGRNARMAAQEPTRVGSTPQAFSAAHRALYFSALGARHAVRAVVPGLEPDRSRARRAASRRALRTLMHPSDPPPFCPPPHAALWLEPGPTDPDN